MKFAGHDFQDEALLVEALTTTSYRHDYPKARDNQRLEFLGDAVLGMLAAEQLFGEFGNEPEGSLSVRRTHMVSATALCAAAERLNIADRLRRNRGAEPLPKNSKIIADAVEAIIGAAYVDGGFEAAREVYETLELPAQAGVSEWSDNPKGELQVRSQAMHPPRRPVYTLLKTEGPSHEPVFTVRVSVDGVGEATASARTLREAEAAAAVKVLTAAAS